MYHDRQLVDAGGLAKPCSHATNSVPTAAVISHREALLLRQHHDIQTIFRHIDSANESIAILATPPC